MRISGPFLPLALLPILINTADQWPAADIDGPVVSAACSSQKGANVLPPQHLLGKAVQPPVRLSWVAAQHCIPQTPRTQDNGEISLGLLAIRTGERERDESWDGKKERCEPLFCTC
ncbi:hypothetical protein AOLI_G00296080 [Acnodon oligacanthus]